MADYSKEVDRFEEFLEKEYQLFLNQQDVYKEYLQRVFPLSECLMNITNNGTSYICFSVLRRASEAAGDETEFTMGPGEEDFFTTMRDELVNFIYERIIASYPEELNDFSTEEEMQYLVTEVFNQTMEQTMSQFQVQEDDTEN